VHKRILSESRAATWRGGMLDVDFLVECKLVTCVGDEELVEQRLNNERSCHLTAYTSKDDNRERQCAENYSKRHRAVVVNFDLRGTVSET